MAESIVDQNKKLSNAAGSPKDTSARNENAEKFSEKVAQGSEKIPLDKENPGDPVKKLPPNSLRGSFEGLDLGSKTLINASGAGYDNKNFQVARYNKSMITHENNFVSDSLNLNKKYSIMDNYSSNSIRGTSSDRLSKIVKNNMMFG